MIVFGLLGTVAWAAGPAPAHGPASALARFEFTEVHMGLPVRIVLHAGDEASARAGARAAFARIAALDALLSDYRPDSELNRLSATSGRWVPASPELIIVLARALDIARRTDGAFDPTLGPLVALWRDARGTGRLPAADTLAAARARTGWRLVELDETRRAVRLRAAGMRLDLGGIAKGFILDEALAALRARGLTRILLEAGGDIVTGDPPPGRDGWRIDAPGANDEFRRRAAALVNVALATSGGTVQFVEIDGVRYSHVLDPDTGIGLTHDLVVHVIAPDGATADALATALGVAGPTRAAGIAAEFPAAVIAVAHLGSGTPEL